MFSKGGKLTGPLGFALARMFDGSDLGPAEMASSRVDEETAVVSEPDGEGITA